MPIMPCQTTSVVCLPLQISNQVIAPYVHEDSEALEFFDTGQLVDRYQMATADRGNALFDLAAVASAAVLRPPSRIMRPLVG